MFLLIENKGEIGLESCYAETKFKSGAFGLRMQTKPNVNRECAIYFNFKNLVLASR